MRFKVTYYNPITLRIKRDIYEFIWDGINHCWIHKGYAFAHDPKDLVTRWADYLRHDGDYVTIKKMA